MASERIEVEIERREDYALRRVKGIPNNKRLWDPHLFGRAAAH